MFSQKSIKSKIKVQLFLNSKVANIMKVKKLEITTLLSISVAPNHRSSCSIFNVFVNVRMNIQPPV